MSSGNEKPSTKKRGSDTNDFEESTKQISKKSEFQNLSNLLSAHKKCHFSRVFFDCEADFQILSASIFNRLNINF